jgi:hypothetical protein
MRGRYKQKRKRKKAKQDFPSQIVVDDPSCQEHPDNRKEDHVVEIEKNWKGLLKNKISDTAAAALFISVLALCAAFWQGCISRQTMRIDERPWLKIIPQMDVRGPQEGMAQLGTIKLLNSGKTPAKNIFVDVDIEKLPSNNNPSLDYNNPHVIAKTGMLYPGQETTPVDFIPVGTLRDLQMFYLIPINSDEMRRFSLGEMVFVVYVKASYTDFFHVEHWTHFCTWIANETVTKEPRQHNVNDCTEYNDTDNN